MKPHGGCYHHDYPAVDIFTGDADDTGPENDRHLTIVAYTAGTVVWEKNDDCLVRDENGDLVKDENDLWLWTCKEGVALKIAGDDGRWYFYGHHYQNLVHKGDRVVAGQPIALTDSTGNAVNTPEHLHFHISRTSNTFTDPSNYYNLICPIDEFYKKFNLDCQWHSCHKYCKQTCN